MPSVTVARSFAVDMAAYLEAIGVDSRAVAQSARIDLAAEEGRLTGAQMAAFWQAAVRAAQDPDLGLHTATASGVGTLDIVGYVMLSSRTAADALRRGARLMRLLNDGLDLLVEVTPVATTATLVALGDARDPLWSEGRQVRETIMAGLVHQLRQLTGTAITPRAVRLPHPRPAHGDAAHRRVFGVAPRFDAEDCAVELDTRALDAPLRSANAALLVAFEAHAEAALAALDVAGATTRQVAAQIMSRLKGEAPSIAQVARGLAMSARSLQRALTEEGTSYQQVLDEVRRELAARHLAAGETVAKVAWLVGFSEPSAFYRAQRRWTRAC